MLSWETEQTRALWTIAKQLQDLNQLLRSIYKEIERESLHTHTKQVKPQKNKSYLEPNRRKEK